jgi:hypothetical protein
MGHMQQCPHFPKLAAAINSVYSLYFYLIYVVWEI